MYICYNMPSLEVWGPAVWTLFHTLAERVHEDAYPYISNQLFTQIIRICKVLPCPDCSTDASIFLAKVIISTLKSKTDFKNFIYLFHNYVNAKKRKPLFNVLNLNMYNNYKLIPVVNNFFNNFNTKGNMNLINESFQRSLVINNFKKWLLGNLHFFTQPPRIQSPLKEIISVEEPIANVVEEDDTNVVEEEPVSFIIEEDDTNVEEDDIVYFEEEHVSFIMEEDV